MMRSCVATGATPVTIAGTTISFDAKTSNASPSHFPDSASKCRALHDVAHRGKESGGHGPRNVQRVLVPAGRRYAPTCPAPNGQRPKRAGEGQIGQNRVK